jgi:tight adherence protein B
MVPLALSLGFGLAVYLIFEGLTHPRPLDLSTWLGGRRDRVERRVADFLAGAGLHEVAPHQFLLASLATGLVAALVAQLTLGWPFVTAVGFALGLAIPFAYYARRRDQRRALLRLELADAIDQLGASVKAGLSIGEALAALGAHGPSGMRSEWQTVVRDQRLIGLGPALEGMRQRMADPVVDTIAVALTLAETSGGHHLSAVLDRLSASVRGRVQLLDAARAEQSRYRLAAQVIAALPIVLLLLVRSENPDYLAVYDTLLGQLVIGLAVVLVGAGYVLMLVLARLPDEPRVLR